MFPRLGSDGAIRIRKKDQRVRWLSQGKAGEFKRLRAVFGAGMMMGIEIVRMDFRVS